jgi:hypothetical protein
MGRRVGGLAAPHDLGVLACTYGVYTRTSPLLTLSFPVDRLRHPTDVQRTLNVCSTTVQRMFNGRSTSAAFFSTDVGKAFNQPLPITHYPCRYLCGPGAGGGGVIWNARIKFFAQKAGNPDKSPCLMPDQVGTFGATMEQVPLTSSPQAGCEVQLPQFEASWCLLALIEPNWPRKGQPNGKFSPCHANKLKSKKLQALNALKLHA